MNTDEECVGRERFKFLQRCLVCLTDLWGLVGCKPEVRHDSVKLAKDKTCSVHLLPDLPPEKPGNLLTTMNVGKLPIIIIYG
jgi:hypothetical protein